MLTLMLGGAVAPHAQQQPLPVLAPDTAPHRTRLILKDGSYQLVMSYTVTGNVVRYVSAERGGDTEEIPLRLVDLDATKQWERRHTPGAAAPPVLDPELAKEEADRAAIMPEVAPNLKLPEQESVLVLDTWQGTPELVPLTQSDGELNRQTGHSVLRGILNPRAAPHRIVTLKGETAAVQLHVSQPELYLRMDDATIPDGEAMTIDTHGADNRPDKTAHPPADATYVVVRVDVRQDARVVTSFDAGALGTTRRQEDLIETDSTLLPGGHWRKIVPTEPLLMGEYALVEVLSDHEINLGVWDFGVHPRAPENRDAMRPRPKRLPTLAPREPQ
jgi:hypothetical protein